MPDYFFEYGHDGNISKMTATEEGSNNYYTWKYVYENGLRTVERCYLKGRSLVGSVEYIYGGTTQVDVITYDQMYLHQLIKIFDCAIKINKF